MHYREPNKIVRKLYAVGYFIGDFVPLLFSLINGVYWVCKQLIAFIVGLLIESSIFIVIIGSIIFSVSHSIRQLRSVGATNGLEFIGVLMFEVIYIGASATLTSFLMKRRLPNGFMEWMGLGFTFLGFIVGLTFVWWSNVKGMVPTLEGRIIGSMVPVLVLISEGILAFRYISDLQHDTDNNQHNENGDREKADKNKIANANDTTDADDNQDRNTKSNNVEATKVVNMSERKKRKGLDPETVVAIFLAKGSNAHIGRKFGVSPETVRKIKLGERHADITAPYRQAK
jgi:hypothetical protein